MFATMVTSTRGQIEKAQSFSLLFVFSYMRLEGKELRVLSVHLLPHLNLIFQLYTPSWDIELENWPEIGQFFDSKIKKVL